MDISEIRSILQKLGAHVPPASHLTLIGGGALALLGSPRPTVDIDFIGDDLHPSELHQAIMQAARELDIDVEPVPFDQFIPLLEGSEQRNIRIGQFGNLEVTVADPYSLALSKLERGFDTDFDDLVFLVRHKHVNLGELEHITLAALEQAGRFDMQPKEILTHLQELKNRLNS